MPKVIYFYAEQRAMHSHEFHTGDVELRNAQSILEKFDPTKGWIVEFSDEPYDYIESEDDYAS